MLTMPPSSAPSLNRRKGIRPHRPTGAVGKCILSTGASRELILIAAALMLAMTIFFIGIQMGSHHSSPQVVATNDNIKTINAAGDINHHIRRAAGVDKTNSDPNLQRNQQQRQAEESLLDDEESRKREVVQEKDDGDSYYDDGKLGNARLQNRDSVKVAKPPRNREQRLPPLVLQGGERNDPNSNVVMESIRDEIHQRQQDFRKELETLHHPHENGEGRSSISEEENETKDILKAHEENMKHFAQHIHRDEQGHFGDLDTSIGIELNSMTRASLPNLMPGLFRTDGEPGVKFIFSAWVQLDPQEEDETGSKRILSVGPDLPDCQKGNKGRGEAHTGNSGMIRFYVNHDQTADEELIFEWSPGAGRGCYTLASVGYQVPIRKWTHVAFSIDPVLWEAKLYINGELAADEQHEEASGLTPDLMHNIPGEKLVSDTHDGNSVMFLGRGMEQMDEHGQLSMTLDGRIASVAIWSQEKTMSSILMSSDGEVGLMSQVYVAGYDVTAVTLSERLRPLQPDYVYSLKEWDKIKGEINSGHDVNVVLQEANLSRHGSFAMDIDRVTVPKAKVQNEEHKLQAVLKANADNRERPNLRAPTFTAKLDPNNPFKNFTPEGGRRYEEYKEGSTPRETTPEMIEKSDALARERREYVKDAMLHVWSGYKKYAFGADELLPHSKLAQDNWGGLGATLIDALDTLWLMGLHDEFWEARDWVRDKLSYDNVGAVSVFETTIRSLGGLLSAYDWSGDVAFLEKADDLGSRLIHAFESPNGLPYQQTELNGHKSFSAGWMRNNVLVAEIGTLQLEFRYLAHATKKAVYAEKVNKVFDMMAEHQPASGLYPLYVRNDKPGVIFGNNKISLGAMGDSFYEYMLKVWIQGGETEEKYRTMFEKAMDGVHEKLVQKSVPNGLTYVADLVNGRLDRKMDHLACFMGGLWALGAYTNPDGLDSPKAQRDLAHGKALTYTCYQMYARFPTSLSPEFVRFNANPSVKEDFVAGSAQSYLLRPEAVESMFILNYLTGDPIYREWGWEIFQAIERFCRTEEAYGQFKNVLDAKLLPDNKMESFFLAETLKYLYLLFDPDTEVDILNTHVFNTEAHPLRRFDRFEEEEADLEAAES